MTYDTLGAVDGTEVITFSGKDIPASATRDDPAGGQLNMTTISITDSVPLFEALGLWATGRYALAPREDYFPPDKTVDEVKEQDAQAFRDSQSAAEIAVAALPGLPERDVRRERSRTAHRAPACCSHRTDRRDRRHPVTDFAVPAGGAGGHHARPGRRGHGAPRRQGGHRRR